MRHKGKSTVFWVRPKGDGRSLYTALFLLFLVAGFIGVAALLVGGLLGPKKGNQVKLDAYESGVPVSSNARERFPAVSYTHLTLPTIYSV